MFFSLRNNCRRLFLGGNDNSHHDGAVVRSDARSFLVVARSDDDDGRLGDFFLLALGERVAEARAAAREGARDDADDERSEDADVANLREAAAKVFRVIFAGEPRLRGVGVGSGVRVRILAAAEVVGVFVVVVHVVVSAGDSVDTDELAFENVAIGQFHGAALGRNNDVGRRGGGRRRRGS